MLIIIPQYKNSCWCKKLIVIIFSAFSFEKYFPDLSYILNQNKQKKVNIKNLIFYENEE